MLVVAIGFSVCFFKEDDPKLLITLPTPAENQILAIGFGGDEPVKFYKFPDAVKAEPNQKITIFNINVLKKSLDEVVVLGQTGERAEEVAVSKLALADVIGFYAFVEEGGFFEKLGVVFPFEQGHVRNIGS